ncbi:hypothetical protein LN042_24010 [Kitasatospora sp. RB6PN24]|uniref:hypothetical protein n=1 Tax=Kitasatospora humi TaxID=2893891 RepID=UPI001E41499C|nr:hypothetical protein [Kitasatospora humi]MCC9310095.1 hypothetical protein [Kitasatospora humi]
MPATNGAPDLSPERDRWFELQDQLAQVRTRLDAETSQAIASIDACLARLATLRRQLADQP